MLTYGPPARRSLEAQPSPDVHRTSLGDWEGTDQHGEQQKMWSSRNIFWLLTVTASPLTMTSACLSSAACIRAILYKAGVQAKHKRKLCNSAPNRITLAFNNLRPRNDKILSQIKAIFATR